MLVSLSDYLINYLINYLIDCPIDYFVDLSIMILLAGEFTFFVDNVVTNVV